jgi:hypothetical protein
MLTQAIRILGSAISRVPLPQIERQTDALKLGARLHDELDLGIGSAGLFLVGFLMIFGLGFLTGSVWNNSKLGAGAGGCICAVGITGVLLHYARSRVLNRRIERLMSGEVVENPLEETFWTSSSDVDLILQLAIGIVVFGLTYVS